jgi:hypothetical protein
MEENFGQDEFVITGPVWIVANKTAITLDDRLRITGYSDLSAILAMETPQGDAVVIFTDRDLAERSVEESGNSDLTIASFRTQADFLDFLQRIVNAGCPNVAFDPGARAHVLPIVDFLKAVKKG